MERYIIYLGFYWIKKLIKNTFLSGEKYGNSDIKIQNNHDSCYFLVIYVDFTIQNTEKQVEMIFNHYIIN